MITINNIELEYNFENLLFLGDLHDKWEKVQQFLKSFDLQNTIIFQVGDFGVGFKQFEKEQRSLDQLNTFLKKRNSQLIVIRGNHDNPAFFTEDLFKLTHITLVPDYTIASISIMGKSKKIFCIGGAISIDRKQKTEGVDWWANEIINETSDMSLLNQIKEIDVIVSHTSPEFVAPFTMGPLVDTFAKDDPYLKLELIRERQLLGNMMGYILKANPTCKYYFYGHFHRNEISWYNEVRFECLAIEQFKELNNL